MPKSVRDRILNALDDLSSDQLQRFRRKLSEIKRIGYGRLEKQSTVEITETIVSKFKTSGAIACTAEVFRAIDLNDEADLLEQDENDCEAVAAMGGPAGATGGCATSISSKPTGGKHFVDNNFVELIDRVTEVKRILDPLLQLGMISGEMYNSITAEKTPQDKMRMLLLQVIYPLGDKAKDTLVEILEKEQPYLMDTLRGK